MVNNWKEIARCRGTNLENYILVVFELNHHVSRLPVHIPRLNQLYFFLFDLHLIVLFLVLLCMYKKFIVFFSPF
jgi:hypothetical protein